MAQDSNRIEVDLNILKGAELKRLNEVASQFEDSIKLLANTLGGYKTQVAVHRDVAERTAGSGIGAGMVRDPSSGFFVPANDYQQDIEEGRKKQAETNERNRRQWQDAHGNDKDRAEAVQERLREQFLNSSKFANTKLGGWLGHGQRSLAPEALTSMEQQHFTVDALAQRSSFTNLLQYMGYRAGGRAGVEIDSSGRVTVDNERALRASARYSTAAQGSIMAQRVAQPILRAGRSVLNHSAGNYGARQLGYDVGADSTLGWQTLGPASLTTEGGRRSLAMKWSDIAASMNLGYGSEAASERGGLMRGMGLDYGRSFGESATPYGKAVGDMMKDIHMRTGIDQQSIAAVMEERRRWRPDEFADIPDFIDSLGESAKGAGMALDEYAKAAIAAASTLRQTHGMSGTTADQVVASGAAMGLKPEEAAAMVDPSRALRAGATSGVSMYEAMGSPHLLAEQAQREASMVARVSPEEFRKVLKEKGTSASADRAYDDMMNRVTMAWRADSSRFGGLTPEQLAQIDEGDLKRGEVQRRIAKSKETFDKTERESGYNSITKTSLSRDLRESGVDKEAIEEVMGEGDYGKRLDLALEKLAETSKDDKNKGLFELEIGLTDDASKLIKLFNKGEEVVADRNTQMFVSSIPGIGSGAASVMRAVSGGG